MVDWSSQFCAIPVLCFSWMLAHRPVQQPLRSPGHYFLDLPLFCTCMLLASFHQYLVAYVCCQILPWLRHWSQISHRPYLRCRDYTSPYPRCPGHAMADVDGLWDHVGLCCEPLFLQSCGSSRDRWTQLAIDDGIRHAASSGCRHMHLHVPGIAEMVHEQGTTFQGLSVNV